MKTVVRLMFIVCVAVSFSSNAFAVWKAFYIKNHTRRPIDVSTGYGYCIHEVKPTQKKIMPGSHFMFMVNVNSYFFSKCGWLHSSQDFKVTFTSANHQKYSVTITYYFHYNGDLDVIHPKIPTYEHIKIGTDFGVLDNRDDNHQGWIVTFSE